MANESRKKSENRQFKHKLEESARRRPMTASDMASQMSAMFYAEWYKKDVSPHLTKEQKMALLKKISDYSLEHPFLGSVNIPKSEFPELAPYSHTETFSGTQLYAVMSELFNEVMPNKLETPYPHFPSRKKR